jgi:hypothetical protein
MLFSMKNARTEQTGIWSKTPSPNFVRYEPSARYFARIRVHGKLIRQGPEVQKSLGSQTASHAS